MTLKFKDKLINFITENRYLIVILLFSFILRVIYLFIDYPLWWDSHVYIVIGKYIFSQGNIGMWESFRPLIHPFILGLIWKLNLSPLIVGKILDLTISLIVIYLTYFITHKIFQENKHHKNIALLSALIFSITPNFIIFTGLILTEPLAILFGLLAIIVIINYEQKNKQSIHLFLAGIFLSLSFLTKFPQGLWFASVIIVYSFRKIELQQKIKQLTLLTIGFILPVIPYLILNYILYNNPFEPFITGSWIVTTSTWLYKSGFSYYFITLFLETPIFLFTIIYLYYFTKEKHFNDSLKLITLLIPILTFIYFLTVPRKEIRYLVTILPFLTIITSYTIIKIYQHLKQKKKTFLTTKGFIALCIILIMIPIPFGLAFERQPTFKTEINELITIYNINGTILTSDPAFVSYLNLRIVTLDGMEFAPQIYTNQKNKYQLIFINDCDLNCAPTDQTCENTKKELIAKIQQENQEVFKKQVKNCTYSISLPIQK